MLPLEEICEGVAPVTTGACGSNVEEGGSPLLRSASGMMSTLLSALASAGLMSLSGSSSFLQEAKASRARKRNLVDFMVHGLKVNWLKEKATANCK